jgi:hypothetical protein
MKKIITITLIGLSIVSCKQSTNKLKGNWIGQIDKNGLRSNVIFDDTSVFVLTTPGNYLQCKYNIINDSMITISQNNVSKTLFCKVTNDTLIGFGSDEILTRTK